MTCQEAVICLLFDAQLLHEGEQFVVGFVDRGACGAYRLFLEQELNNISLIRADLRAPLGEFAERLLGGRGQEVWNIGITR